MSEDELAWKTVSLLPGETRLYAGDRIVRYETRVGADVARPKVLLKKADAYFFATNQRLIFVERHGIFNVSFRTTTVPYEKIASISGSGWATRFLVVTIVGEMRAIDHCFSISSVEEDRWIRWIHEMMTHRRLELEMEEKRKRIQIVMDFSFLKTAAERGGLMLSVISCPYCTGRVQLPESGNICRCEHCGRAIYATDIFDRMRQLVSDFREGELPPPPPPL